MAPSELFEILNSIFFIYLKIIYSMLKMIQYVKIHHFHALLLIA